MATQSFGIQGAIRALDEQFNRDANAGDATALVAGYYADDAVLLPPNAPAVRGADAIREFWASFIAAGAADVTIETTDAGESGDVAYGIGTYSVTLPDGSGGRARDDGKFLVVFRRAAGGDWRVIADQFNTSLAAH